MKSRKLQVVVGILLAIMMASTTLLLGCPSETTTAPQTTSAPTTSAPTTVVAPTKAAPTAAAPTKAAPVAKPTKTFKVGGIWWLGNAQGLDAYHAAQTWADVTNGKGGLNVGGEKYKVEIIAYDSNNSQVSAVSAANRLVFEDNVKYILHDPYLVESYIPITEANKVILVGGTPSGATVKAGLNYTFNSNGANFAFPVSFAWYYKNYPELCERYVMVAPDDQNGHFSTEFFGGVWKALGVSPTYLYYPAGSTDMSAVATKVMSLNPTTVDCCGGGDIMDSSALKSVYQSGYKGQFFSGIGSTLDVLKQYIPVDALNGLICSATSVEFTPPATQLAKDFIAAYAARYGKWETFGASAEFLILLAAIEQCGSLDADAVINKVYSGFSYESMDGPGQMVIATRTEYDGKTRDSINTKLMKQFGENYSVNLKASITPEEGLELYKMYLPSYSPK